MQLILRVSHAWTLPGKRLLQFSEVFQLILQSTTIKIFFERLYLKQFFFPTTSNYRSMVISLICFESHLHKMVLTNSFVSLSIFRFDEFIPTFRAKLFVFSKCPLLFSSNYFIFYSSSVGAEIFPLFDDRLGRCREQ
jgi:hypothetical protein